jgi:hypothetical protein
MAFALIIATAIGVFSLKFFLPNWLVGLSIVIIAGLAYYQFSFVPAQRAAEQLQGN